MEGLRGVQKNSQTQLVFAVAAASLGGWFLLLRPSPCSDGGAAPSRRTLSGMGLLGCSTAVWERPLARELAIVGTEAQKQFVAENAWFFLQG